MTNRQNFRTEVAGKTLELETGRFAGLAGGAVTARMGDTVIFASATMSKAPRDTDFFPLSVDYEEKLYAAGRIPGSFFRREGRPAEAAILTSRVVDRTLRPLFPKDMRNDVQIILTAFSHDQENYPDILGIIAASAALTISDIPWDGPVAGVRIGLIDDELIVNPIISDMEDSLLDLRVSGTAAAINMVECGAHEVNESTMIRAMSLAHETIQPIVALQEEMKAQLGKLKSPPALSSEDKDFILKVTEEVQDEVKEIVERSSLKEEQREAIRQITESQRERFAEKEVNVAEIDAGIQQAFNRAVRERIVQHRLRPDGREPEQLRRLYAETGLFPRVHGSGLFERGETQVLTVATLGTPRESQILDGLHPEDSKRYLHHYNFPPYSTGETWPLRGTKRREIGHGALAETALRSVLPTEDEFPYTIRLVSEVLSSNGSTSMASVCGSTLALMDAGVPIIRPVAGIAMGLIQEGEAAVILTDIQGMEDHLGDMDFKVAGTEKGITALQMDIKISGITEETIAKALEQARTARLEILEVMQAVIAAPRQQLSDHAPRMTTIKVSSEKIGAVIGPGGKTVRGIQDRLGVKVDIQEDGTIFIAGMNGPSVQEAEDEISLLTEDAELGRIYTGRVRRIEPYGAFVEFLPGKDGLVHISQLADYRVETVESEVALDDEIMVMVIDVSPEGKVRLSRQAVLEGWTVEEARERDRGVGGGGRRREFNRGQRGGRSGGNRRDRR
ncbi:MAG: polyribonucleotide nucleotidyltransferase [Chloroflexi bacterium]|nr:polyribonucleotide nucleotidyltransferase [Chloroflexota bacterium]